MKSALLYILLIILLTGLTGTIVLTRQPPKMLSCLFQSLAPNSINIDSCIGKKAAKAFDVESVSDKIQFLGPYKEVLGVTFQHTYELMEGVQFSEFTLPEVKVVKLPTKDKDNLIVEKNDKEISFPVVGVLGFKSRETSSYEPVLVRLLGSRLKVGDIVNVHATYINPSSVQPIKQIREKLISNLVESPFKREAALHVNSRENSGIKESQILGIIYNNSVIIFQPDQLIVTSLEFRQ